MADKYIHKYIIIKDMSHDQNEPQLEEQIATLLDRLNNGWEKVSNTGMIDAKTGAGEAHYIIRRPKALTKE